ncbi:hypothetical protein D9M72_630960 [compost metagenome]
MLRRFANHLGMPTRARAAFVRQIERDVGIPIGRLDVGGYQLEIPALIAHAEDDSLVPASEAQAIHRAWFDSRLLMLPDGGHQRVLSDPKLIDGVMALLTRRLVPARQSA